jgi:UDP-GlcNAc:undecaprenyl-phosphate GlcNAc-1-phosphate transferase
MDIAVLKIILIFLTTFLGTLFILPELIKIASTWIVTKTDSSDEKYSLMDIPDNQRKIHKNPKPLVGGIGMLVVVSFSSVLFVTPTDINLRGYYSSVIMLGIVGFLDDFSDLHYSYKFIAQMLASIIMMKYSNTILQSFGNIVPFFHGDLGYFALPVTILSAIGVINAINMLDGLDGLAGGVSLIAFISFAIFAFVNGQIEIMLLSVALIGALSGFLRYNWYPSKLFMGDAGSSFLGFSLTFLSIFVTQGEGNLGIVPPVAPLLILTVPIVDTVTVMTKRMLKGKSPFFADKSHLHHMLMRLGLSVKSSVKMILFLSVIFALLGVLGALLEVSEQSMFLVFITYFVLNIAVHFVLERILNKRLQTATNLSVQK